jgi:hypothetical protein
MLGWITDRAFINEILLGYCRKREFELTRSRAYKKNDQAWIEQKTEPLSESWSAMADWKALTPLLFWLTYIK